MVARIGYLGPVWQQTLSGVPTKDLTAEYLTLLKNVLVRAGTIDDELWRVRPRNFVFRTLERFLGLKGLVLARSAQRSQDDILEGRGDVVPEIDIDRAVERMKSFKRSPSDHTYEEGSKSG